MSKIIEKHGNNFEFRDNKLIINGDESEVFNLDDDDNCEETVNNIIVDIIVISQFNMLKTRKDLIECADFLFSNLYIATIVSFMGVLDRLSRVANPITDISLDEAVREVING